MRLATTLSLLLIAIGLNAQTPQNIKAISPTGIFVKDTSTQLVFEWETSFPYEGNFWLKVMELDPRAVEPPTNFPDTGLLLDLEVRGNRLLYPENAPPIRGGERYAWQIETIEAINGSRVVGPIGVIGVISLNDLLSCDINYSGLPSNPICPGDCFTLDIDLPSLSWTFPPITHHLTLYADYPNLPPGAITVDGLDVYDQSLFCGVDVEQPHATTNFGTYGLTICLNEPLDSPIEFELYYNRPQLILYSRSLWN